jgi:uncharacterized membrane protein YfcA
MARGLPVAGCAAAAGSALLLSTSVAVFTQVVPYLVAAASVALLLQPRLSALARSPATRSNLLAWPLVGGVSIYSGYFGAGSGIMLLVVLLVLVDDRLPEANALKNMLLGVGSLAAAAVFLLAGPVEWAVVAPLAVGLFAGSTVGPVIARRVPVTAVRWAVAALGFVLAVELWLRPD